MTDILERTKNFFDINDIQTSTIFSILNSIPAACIIIKEATHELVWYNTAFSDNYSQRLPNMEGLSISQMIGCMNSYAKGQFSYSDYCADCPLHMAIDSLNKGEKVKQRGVISIPAPWGKTDLHVETYADSIKLQNQDYLIIYLEDISSEATRYQLNRTFFHDLLNIGQQLRSSVNLSQMIIEDTKQDGYRVPTQLNKELELISNSVSIITDKVNKERQLNNAQNDTLIPHLEQCNPREILCDLLQNLRKLNEQGGRLIVLVPCDPDTSCTTDRILLQQVCYALLHTLIYSSRAEQIIELGYKIQNENIVFWFRNRELSLSSNKIQQFKTEYSLKRTRNVYSYTISILAEKYLQAEIDLESSEDQGTTMYLTIPKQLIFL